MNKFCLFFCLLWGSLCAQETIEGFWKTVNEKTGKAQSIVAIYEYKGKYYGRMIGTFDAEGKIKDSIYDPKERAPGVIGHPYYCGLDIIWNLRKDDSKYKGKILDPEKGNIYNSELWIRDDKLVVRGKLLIFGRSQVWPPMLASDFPPNFKKPDISKFVPVIPQVD